MAGHSDHAASDRGQSEERSAPISMEEDISACAPSKDIANESLTTHSTAASSRTARSDVIVIPDDSEMTEAKPARRTQLKSPSRAAAAAAAAAATTMITEDAPDVVTANTGGAATKPPSRRRSSGANP